MNVVLTGMPGCGKSTVGVLLAKSLLCDFVDTDLILQNTYKMSLCEIIEKYGLDGFKERENKVLSELYCKNSVIATGGSAVYCTEGMENLKKDGVVVYIRLCPETIKGRINNITTRGIAMAPDCTIDSLYEERAELYEKYADITVECEGMTAEEVVSYITEKIKDTN